MTLVSYAHDVVARMLAITIMSKARSGTGAGNGRDMVKLAAVGATVVCVATGAAVVTSNAAATCSSKAGPMAL